MTFRPDFASKIGRYRLSGALFAALLIVVCGGPSVHAAQVNGTLVAYGSSAQERGRYSTRTQLYEISAPQRSWLGRAHIVVIG